MEPKQGLKVADLIMAVVAVAVSLGVWRWHAVYAEGPYAQPGGPSFQAYVNSAIVFLASLTFITTVYELCRVPRRQWGSHPTTVLGLAFLTVATLDLLEAAETANGITNRTGLSFVTLLVDEYVLTLWEDAYKVVLAALLVGIVGGNLVRPRTALEWFGYILALGWILLGSKHLLTWRF